MKTSSCKAKGRRLQNDVAASMLRLIQAFNPHLDGSDVKGAVMGTAGADIVLSSNARDILDWDVECKNVEALNVTSVFLKHLEKYKNKPSLKLLVHKRNHTPTLVTCLWEDFIGFYLLLLVTLSKVKDQASKSELF